MILLLSFLCFFKLTFGFGPSKDHMEEGMMKGIFVMHLVLSADTTRVDVFWIYFF